MVSYLASPNAGGQRSGTVTVGDQTFTVHQEAVSVTSPAPPTGLYAASLDGHMVTLRWTSAAVGLPPTDFAIEGGVNPGEVLASLTTGSAAPAFTFTAPRGSFYVRVRALSGALRSAPSNEIRIHVNVPVAPSPPSNLLALVNGSALALAWTNTYGGGTPTSLVLDVSGSLTTSLSIGVAESFSFAGVPGGTYTLALRARNAGGTSASSNPVTLTFPGACSGPPLLPADVLAYRWGNVVVIDWSAPHSGPAPTGYLLRVTGAAIASISTSATMLSGTVPPGSYSFSVSANNACGASAFSVPQTVVVP
jgi:hypothetical protein